MNVFPPSTNTANQDEYSEPSSILSLVSKATDCDLLNCAGFEVRMLDYSRTDSKPHISVPQASYNSIASLFCTWNAGAQLPADLDCEELAQIPSKTASHHDVRPLYYSPPLESQAASGSISTDFPP